MELRVLFASRDSALSRDSSLSLREHWMIRRTLKDFEEKPLACQPDGVSGPETRQ